ncbi:MAG: HEPN domain-containing protein [Candidatus Thermoplasmatota archaeon]|nr:HEPN domain-containing protein [Candidatus Thermoplasmatota archaeon]
MGDHQTNTSTVQEYYELSCHYLQSAQLSLENGLYEPAMFTAIHALELGLKAALLTHTTDAWRTHNIGGYFAKLFRIKVGDATCRRITVILSQYNLPRYPSEAVLDPQQVEQDIQFIAEVLEQHLPALLSAPEHP